MPLYRRNAYQCFCTITFWQLAASSFSDRNPSQGADVRGVSARSLNEPMTVAFHHARAYRLTTWRADFCAVARTVL